MSSDQLRQVYIQFFQERDHLVMPSSSLIPAGDPTLLLTTAGMVQMKPYFLGEVSPPSRRMTSAQKCFRTTDLDIVGDHKHLTFFEMLGNFSVGDYFKPEAISFAWEFATEKLGLDPERIWVTVYADDDEAYDLWCRTSTVPPEKIYRYGKTDNWWGPPGAEGPCGPCSELHYDFGPERGCSDIASVAAIAQWETDNHETAQPGCHPNCDRCERFVEFWNLVFMQFYQDPSGNLTDLPDTNVDTGMGLERVILILQDAADIYQTDIFKSIIATVSDLSGKEYGQNPSDDRAIRVVAEHARGACFLIADGVVPSNEGRGYVLRRLIRRAVRFGRTLGITKPFLDQVAEAVVIRMSEAYEMLSENRQFILRVLSLEEERFAATYERGVAILLAMVGFRNKIADKLIIAGQPLPSRLYNSLTYELGPLIGGVDENETMGQQLAADAILLDLNNPSDAHLQTPISQWQNSLSGLETFTIWDTYGFPIELTEEIAAEHGLSVDKGGFQLAMDAQRTRAKSGAKTSKPVQAKIFSYRNLGIEGSRFVGHIQLSERSVVLALLVEGESVSQAEVGAHVDVMLRETPFYAEGGGQVGDAGEIVSAEGMIVITDTQAPIAGLIVHTGEVLRGSISVGDPVTALVNPERRGSIARNHTGTHLAHAALRRVLGAHVRQAGSMVGPDRLRFDFSHIEAPSPEELQAVEGLVNQQVLLDLPIHTEETNYAHAVEEGALAFFGDKYGETIRIVRMASNNEPFSFEVCGGTHLGHTSEVGLFLITSESSIGSGLRRIEALTGSAAQAAARADRNSLEALSKTLEATPAELHGRVETLLKELDQERKRNLELERRMARQAAAELLTKVQKVDGVNVLVARIETSSSETMRDVGDYLRHRLRSGVVVLGALINDRPSLMAMVTPDIVELGLDAVTLVREAGKTIGGGGGGRPELAQAGGNLPGQLDAALLRIPSLVRR
jgi:alanyl-tRNA synthetase